MGLLLKLLDQRCDDFGRQLGGSSDQKRLCATAGFLGAAFEVDVPGIPKWVKNLLGQVLFVEGNTVGCGGKLFDIVRGMRPATVHIGEGFEIGALLWFEGGKCLKFLHVEAENFLKGVSGLPDS